MPDPFEAVWAAKIEVRLNELYLPPHARFNVAVEVREIVEDDERVQPEQIFVMRRAGIDLWRSIERHLLEDWTDEEGTFSTRRFYGVGGSTQGFPRRAIRFADPAEWDVVEASLTGIGAKALAERNAVRRARVTVPAKSRVRRVSQ